MGEPGCRWIGRAANPGIQMGKTPLCTDAAEPVAGGATADKYVSRQHHGSVAHRAETRSLRYPDRAAPRCPRHTTSCTARRTSQFLFGTWCLSSLSSPSRREARSFSHFQSLFISSFPSSRSFSPSFCRSFSFFSLSSSPSAASRRISLPRTSLPLSFYSGSRGGSVPRFYIVHLNIMEMSTLSWTRGIVLPCLCHPTGSPARSRGEEKERREEPSARELSDWQDSPSPPRFPVSFPLPSVLSDEYISQEACGYYLPPHLSYPLMRSRTGIRRRAYSEARYYTPLSRGPCHFRVVGTAVAAAVDVLLFLGIATWSIRATGETHLGLFSRRMAPKRRRDEIQMNCGRIFFLSFRNLYFLSSLFLKMQV